MAASILESIAPLIQLLGDMPDETDAESRLNNILDIARKLMDADRAEIARWNNQGGKLIITAQRGQAPSKACVIGEKVQDKGMLSKAWNSKGEKPAAVFSKRLLQGKGYVQADERTKAEAAIRIQHKNRRIGVLNLEWFKEIDWTPDRETLLRLLGKQTALAISMADRELELSSLGGAVTDEKESQAICAMLERKSEERGITNALVFEADKEQGLLHANYFLDKQKATQSKDGPEHWSYEINSVQRPSFADYVYQSGTPQWLPDASKSPHVNQDGVRKYKIKGPILGLPLLHEGIPVGVVVLWGGQVPNPSIDSLASMKPLTDMLALRLSKVSLNKGALEKLTQIVRGAQGYVGPDEAMVGLLRTIQACGFDRVRYLRHAPDQNAFIRVQDVDEKSSVNNTPVVIPIDKASHASWILKHFNDSPHARVFDPKKDGVDPYHKELGKGPDTLWISAFISLRGKLMGQICADNEKSKQPFPPFAKPLLGLASAIAALILDRVSSGSQDQFLDIFPTAMFRKDRFSRFQWVNDVFTEDVAKCCASRKDFKGDLDICHKINSSSDKTSPGYRLLIDRLREWIIGKNDQQVFGDSDISRSYMERDREVMGWCRKRKKFYPEMAATREWAHEQNAQGERIRLVHVVKSPIFDASGKPVGVQGFYLSDALARIFVESNVGIFQSTPDGRFIYVNDRLAELLGYESNNNEAIYKLKLEEDVYYSANDRAVFVKEIEGVNHISDFEFFMKRPGIKLPGSESPLRLKVAEYAWAVTDEKGDVRYYEGFVRDISSRIKTSASVTDKDEEEIGAFIARIIGHEVSNPLQVAGAETAALLKMKLDVPDALFERLSRSFHHARRVLESYQLGDNEGKYSARNPMGGPAVLDQVIKERLCSLLGALQASGFAKPDYERLKAGRSRVVIPVIKIMQLITNLVKNSMESRNLPKRSKRKILISTEVRDLDGKGIPTHAILRYEDTAGGMPEAKAARLFLRDERRDGGLGMLVVAKMLDRYNCPPPHVKSEVGKGSVFTFTIPLYHPN